MHMMLLHAALANSHFIYPYIKINCFLGYLWCITGPAVMVRKGDHVVDWWNAALERLVSSGRYRRLCQQARDKHGKLCEN
jgi:ABC-type amino acid transport substrate-binding protein